MGQKKKYRSWKKNQKKPLAGKINKEGVPESNTEATGRPFAPLSTHKKKKNKIVRMVPSQKLAKSPSYWSARSCVYSSKSASFSG